MSIHLIWSQVQKRCEDNFFDSRIARSINIRARLFDVPRSMYEIRANISYLNCVRKPVSIKSHKRFVVICVNMDRCVA